MNPPEASPLSLIRIRFSRWRSSSEAILRLTPTCVTVGMKTRKRPGKRDVAGDARALLGDRLLGDLNQDFLALASAGR